MGRQLGANKQLETHKGRILKELEDRKNVLAKELEGTKNGYALELEAKRSELAKQLEAAKNIYAKDLEDHRTTLSGQLDKRRQQLSHELGVRMIVTQADLARLMSARELVTAYRFAVGSLRMGTFQPEEVKPLAQRLATFHDTLIRSIGRASCTVLGATFMNEDITFRNVQRS